MGKNTSAAPPTVNDDAAEGRGRSELDKPLARSTDTLPAPAEPSAPAQSSAAPSADAPVAAESGAPTPADDAAPAADGAEGAEGEPEQKKVRLSGAQKKALARQKQKEQWEAKKQAKADAKKAATEGGGDDGDEEDGGRKKQKGQNKVRMLLLTLV